MMQAPAKSALDYDHLMFGNELLLMARIVSMDSNPDGASAHAMFDTTSENFQ
jgi:hypothetical protein